MKPRDGTPFALLSPSRLFLRVLAIVLLAEILQEAAFTVLLQSGVLSGHVDAARPIVGALFVGVLIAPALWWFVGRALRGVAMEHMQAAMAVSHAADGVITVTEAGVVESFNPAAERLFGYCEPEILGKPVTSLIPERYRETHQRRLEQVLTSRKPELSGETRELHGLRKDGSEFPLEVSLGAWRVGTQSFCTGMLRDITERKRAEEAVWRAEERYRRLFEDAPVMYVISRSEKGNPVVTDCNEIFLQTLGYTRAETLGRPLANFYTLESRVKLLELGGHQRAWENRFGVEERELLARDGRVIPVLIRAVPETDPGGSVCGTWAMYPDITERKRAEAALAERTRQLEVVRLVSTEIARELDLSNLLELITRRAAELVGATSGVISLWDGEAQLLIPQAWHGFGDWMSEMSIPLGLGVTGTVAERREGMIVNDYRSSRHALPPFLEHTEITAVMAEPLLYHDRLVGVITINNERVGRLFEEKDSETLRLFAAQAAIAIENARLHEAVIRRAQQLATLNELSRTLTTVLDPQGVIREILAAIQTLIPGAVCRVWEHLVGDGTLVLVASVGLRDPEGGQNVQLRLGEGLMGIAAATRQPVVSRDVTQDPRFINRAWAEAEGLVSSLVLPLLHRDHVTGGLAISTRAPHDFTDDEVSSLQAFAAQAVIAMENARLFEEVRAGRERLEALSRRLVEVQEAERRSVARELHDEIGQLLTGLKLVLEMGSRGRVDAMKAQLKEAQVLVSDLMERVRDLSLNLRPAMLDDLGLLPALLWHFERYSAQTQVRVDFQHSGVERRLAPEIETAVYRIVQEALTNVARHAGVREVTVQLWAESETLGVQIQDRGSGFDTGKALAAISSSGLMGMRERALLLGGQFTVESAPGKGTRMRVELPI